jgi:hypothetical protein
VEPPRPSLPARRNRPAQPWVQPPRPTWLWVGPYYSNPANRNPFPRNLGFVTADQGLGRDRIYSDPGLGHGETSHHAYAQEPVYRWLAARNL